MFLHISGGCSILCGGFLGPFSCYRHKRKASKKSSLQTRKLLLSIASLANCVFDISSRILHHELLDSAICWIPIVVSITNLSLQLQPMTAHNGTHVKVKRLQSPILGNIPIFLVGIAGRHQSGRILHCRFGLLILSPTVFMFSANIWGHTCSKIEILFVHLSLNQGAKSRKAGLGYYWWTKCS